MHNRWGTFTCDIPLLLVISMDFGLGVPVFILSIFHLSAVSCLIVWRCGTDDWFCVQVFNIQETFDGVFQAETLGAWEPGEVPDHYVLKTYAGMA